MKTKTDWNQKINLLVEELKYKESIDDGEEFLRKLQDNLERTKLMYDQGLPEQEIIFSYHDEGNIGIPLELAGIVVQIFQFCADHNIDLAEAFEYAA